MDGISAIYVASLDDPVAVRRVLCTITSHERTTSRTQLCSDLVIVVRDLNWGTLANNLPVFDFIEFLRPRFCALTLG